MNTTGMSMMCKDLPLGSPQLMEIVSDGLFIYLTTIERYHREVGEVHEGKDFAQFR